MSSYICTIRVQIVDGYLQFRCDLGSGDTVVSLPDVPVDDGVLHTVKVSRYGNQVILRLDFGEGRYRAEQLPTDSHKLLALDSSASVFAAGDVTVNVWTNEVTIQQNLVGGVRNFNFRCNRQMSS